jgi:hypothetical protein
MAGNPHEYWGIPLRHFPLITRAGVSHADPTNLGPLGFHPSHATRSSFIFCKSAGRVYIMWSAS